MINIGYSKQTYLIAILGGVLVVGLAWYFNEPIVVVVSFLAGHLLAIFYPKPRDGKL